MSRFGATNTSRNLSRFCKTFAWALLRFWQDFSYNIRMYSHNFSLPSTTDPFRVSPSEQLRLSDPLSTSSSFTDSSSCFLRRFLWRCPSNLALSCWSQPLEPLSCLLLHFSWNLLLPQFHLQNTIHDSLHSTHLQLGLLQLISTNIGICFHSIFLLLSWHHHGIYLCHLAYHFIPSQRNMMPKHVQNGEGHLLITLNDHWGVKQWSLLERFNTICHRCRILRYHRNKLHAMWWNLCFLVQGNSTNMISMTSHWHHLCLVVVRTYH